MIVRTFKHNLCIAENSPDYHRSPGLHMSDIYNSMYKAIDPKRYDKYNEDGTPEEMNWTKVAAGSAWEIHFEPILQRTYGGSRPGELFTQHARTCSAAGSPVRDGRVLCHCGAGVAYSPDWLFDEPSLILGEFKFSWYSMRDFPDVDKFDKWLCQVKAYLFHLRLDTCWVFPYWVNGLYPRGVPSPDFDNVYELKFRPTELIDNWSELLRHAWRKGLIP